LTSGKIWRSTLADGNLIFLCKTSELEPGAVKRVDRDGGDIAVSMHFGSFNVKTGEPMAPPCSVAIKTYKVEIKDGDVFAVLD
jgi:nitrite reductase/ring-hydroxylating ferredoxin subunit